MAVLDIVTYPEKSLSRPSEEIETIDEDLKELIRNMGETMYHDAGVGLAAPQVGVNRRLIVYNPLAGDPEADNSAKTFTALINPEIIASSGSFISENEGCLSVPDYRADVKRAEKVTVRAMGIDGKELEFEAVDLEAVIMQHEIDHLNGILFIDRISSLKRAMYRKKVMKKLKTEE